MCDPVSIGEVATLVGVSRQRVYQLRNDGMLPAPRWNLSIGPLWDTADIVAWVESRPPSVLRNRQRRVACAEDDTE